MIPLLPVLLLLLPVQDPPQGRRPPGRGGFDWPSLLRRFDRDGDGKIAKEEFTGREGFFQRLDTDGDGFLTKKEFEALRQRMRGRGRGRGGRGGGSWRRVTGADWRKPTLITWQRSLEDALALSRKEGRPVLICVNVDGEVASEYFAAVKYRDPAFADLVAEYAAVVACPVRHNEKDYDSMGRRIPCPRFGGITCGEHIEVEPLAFERFFQGRRVTPRHMGLSPEGKTLFDRFLEGNLELVDRSLRENAPGLSLDRLLQSRDAAARLELERRFLAGSPGERRKLLASLGDSAARVPDLLRMAMRDEDEGVRDRAFRALLSPGRRDLLPLLLEAFPRITDAGLLESCKAVLNLLAEADIRVRRMLTADEALGRASALLPREAWRKALKEASGEGRSERVPDSDLDALDEKIEDLSRRSAGRPGDAALRLELAEATFRFALNRLQNGRNPTFLLQDAETAVRAPLGDEKLRPRALPLAARIHHLLGHREEAGRLALEALKAPGTEASSARGAEILRIHAGAQRAEAYRPLGEKEDHRASSLTEAHQAHLLLENHPFCTPQDFADHLDFLLWLDARREARKVCDLALLKFPAHPPLHEKLRTLAYRQGGARGLERAYDSLEVPEGAGATMDWFAGFSAYLAAGEYLRDQAPRDAEAGFRKSQDLFEKSLALKAEFEETVDQYVSLCLSSRAWILFERERIQPALELLLESLQRRPGGFETEDSLGRSPKELAGRLRTELQGSGSRESLKKLEETLKRLGLDED